MYDRAEDVFFGMFTVVEPFYLLLAGRINSG